MDGLKNIIILLIFFIQNRMFSILLLKVFLEVKLKDRIIISVITWIVVFFILFKGDVSNIIRLVFMQQNILTIYLFLWVKNLYTKKESDSLNIKINRFLYLVYYSIFQFTLIYFTMNILESNIFNDVSNLKEFQNNFTYETMKVFIESFSFSVSNYLNMQQLSAPLHSSSFKLMASIQQIFSFLTLIIGLTFFIKEKDIK